MVITKKGIFGSLGKGKRPKEGGQSTDTSPQPDQARKLTSVTGKKLRSS
jgi:hypothetical protein